MPSISGKVIFDVNRTATVEPTYPGIENVAVVLQNTSTNVRLTVLTDANGNFQFINVPDGSYRIVESYGQSSGYATPGDFSLATVGEVPVGVDPPITAVPTAPAGATNLDSLTPNTINLTVLGANIGNLNFLDGAVKYTPIGELLDSCTSIIGPNLITSADNGIFGSYPAGTAANFVPATNPYPGLTESTMTYLTAITASGQFTMKLAVWQYTTQLEVVQRYCLTK